MSLSSIEAADRCEIQWVATTGTLMGEFTELVAAATSKRGKLGRADGLARVCHRRRESRRRIQRDLGERWTIPNGVSGS
jgi:hypothetical protein